MWSFFERTKGSISVFLILVLMPMYTCVYLAVDTARYTAAETKVNGAMKLTANAALADYDENLKKLYGIFAMSQDEESLIAELSSYFSNMIDTSEVPFISDSFENVVYTEPAEFSAGYMPESSLVNANILENEIRSFMKYRAPLKIAAETAQKLDAFTQMSELAAVFKYGTEYKEALSAADGALIAVFDCFPENSETNVETVKSSLTDALSALPKLEEQLSEISDESEAVSKSISGLDEGETKVLLQSEYGYLINLLSAKGIEMLAAALKDDIQKLETASGIDGGAEELISNLSYFGNDLYKFLSNTYGNTENLVSKDSAENLNSNLERIASTDLSGLYAICNEQCNYEVSGLIQHSVWQVLYGDTGIPTEPKEDETSQNAESFDFYSDNFASLESLFAELSDKSKKLTQNAYESEYFTEMFARFNTADTEKNLLGIQYGNRNYLLGEAEYIIFGEDWMADNITRSVNTIFAIRLLFNSFFAFSNTEMQKAANAVASTLSGINGLGVLLNKNLLLLTWSMAESVTDISALCKGKSVPIYKNSETWNLDIGSISNALSETVTHDNKETKNTLSMTYKDYLKLFAIAKMYKSGEKEKMMKRAAGVMQINCAQEDAIFDISRCYTKVQLNSSVRVGLHEIDKTEVYGY